MSEKVEWVTQIEQAQQNSASVPWLRLRVPCSRGREGSVAVKGHAKEAYMALEVWLHTFITSVQDGGVC